MKNTLVVLITIVSITLCSCSHSNHKNRPLAVLKTEDSLLAKENAYLELRIDTIMAQSAKTNSDSIYAEATKEDFFKEKLLKEKMDEMLTYLRKEQLQILFVVDNVREPASKDMGLNDIKHPEESYMISHYFYGDNEAGAKFANAHKIREKIGLYKTALLLSLDSLKLMPTDTAGLSISDTAHDASGKLMSWEAYSFDGANAAEDYVLFEKLRNAVLNSGYESLRLLFGDLIDKRDTVVIVGDDGC
ncbi:MAG TPA: hypothetical protein VK890_12725 [Bacteroidia bacterium]|jgi:hypothetical protein|nr:hypothetical protein [Bacteroidia bacterium]